MSRTLSASLPAAAGRQTDAPRRCRHAPPSASTLNYSTGQTVPNHAIARTGPYLGFYNANGQAHLIVDVFGAFL